MRPAALVSLGGRQWRKSRHTIGNSDLRRRFQSPGARPLLTGGVDAISTIHPKLSREIVPRENIVNPVSPVLFEPRLLVLIANQRISVAKILKSSIRSGDVGEISTDRFVR